MLLLPLSLVTACSAPKDEQSLEVVRVSTRKHFSAAPVFIADEEGFFANEGIRLEFVEAPGRSAQAVPLLERGQIDVLSATVGAALFAAGEHNAQLRIVADRGHVSPTGCTFNAIVGSSKVFQSDSVTAEELRGKAFSINAGVTAAWITDLFLESRGLTTDDVRVTTLPDVMEIGAMASGSLDVTHAAEPFLSQFKRSGQRVIGNASTYVPGAHFGAIVFGPTLTVKNRALGQRFMKAYLRGVRQHAAGATARNVEILSKRMGFDESLLRTACFATINEDGHLDVASLNAFQEWSVKKGYLPRIVPMSAVVDTTFAHLSAAALDSSASSH
jgi:NitT/TauT family transport system substrate-binding protein